MLNEYSSTFQDELAPGERLLWSGRPKQGIVFRPIDIIFIPFSLFWGCFTIFWEVTVISQGTPFIFKIWGIPFILVGLYMVIGRFFVDAKLRQRIYYALTSERILLISGLFSKNIKSLKLKTLDEININTKADGSGTITFGRNNPFSWSYSSMPWPGSEKFLAPSFDSIVNARQVYELIRRAQREL
jgi:hypothetical protein